MILYFKQFFLHGFVSFGPNSCCKLFIYILCKQKIYVGHQGLCGTFFSSMERNFQHLTELAITSHHNYNFFQHFVFYQMMRIILCLCMMKEIFLDMD